MRRAGVSSRTSFSKITASVLDCGGHSNPAKGMDDMNDCNSQAVSYGPWCRGFVLRKILFDLSWPSWVVGMLALSVYWGVPFVLSSLSHTLLSYSWASSVTDRLVGLGQLQHRLGRFADSQAMLKGQIGR